MEVTGCDVDLQGIEIAARCNSQVKYVHLSGYEDPQKLGDNNFDAVISTEVIEHLFLPGVSAQIRQSCPNTWRLFNNQLSLSWLSQKSCDIGLE